MRPCIEDFFFPGCRQVIWSRQSPGIKITQAIERSLIKRMRLPTRCESFGAADAIKDLETRNPGAEEMGFPRQKVKARPGSAERVRQRASFKFLSLGGGFLASRFKFPGPKRSSIPDSTEFVELGD
jgi:hypothetical protein